MSAIAELLFYFRMRLTGFSFKKNPEGDAPPPDGIGVTLPDLCDHYPGIPGNFTDYTLRPYEHSLPTGLISVHYTYR